MYKDLLKLKSGTDIRGVALEGEPNQPIQLTDKTVYTIMRAFAKWLSQKYNSQKLIVAGDDTTFDNCKTKEDVEAILQGFGKDVTIGYQNGTTGALYVNGDDDWGFTALNVTPSGFNTAALAAQALINKSIKYVVVDSAPAAAIVKALNAIN